MAAKQEEQQAGRLQDKIDHSMLQSRRIFICSPITDEIAEDTIKKLWYLEETQPGKPILIVINSPGGSVDAGFAIWDQIKMITSPITTCVSGMAASMGSILMLSAPKERRFVTPNSRIMIHQPRLSGPVQGQADDLEIRAREIIKTKQMLIDLYVECTGKKKADIEKAIDRDTWYSAQEAKEFGFFAKVVSSYKDLGL